MQKFADKFGRIHNYLRISLTERCNLRCVYCMPAEGVQLTPDKNILTSMEIQTLAKEFAKGGVDKIRLTGGEPTIRKDFMDILNGIGQIPEINKLAITTNGLAVHRKLKDMKKAGLTNINVSLDTLVEAKFNFLTRRKGLNQVLKTIQTALDVGIENVKINCVVVRNQNEDEMGDLLDLARNNPVQLRFIEYMPFDGNKWDTNRMVSFFEMQSILQTKGYELEKLKHAPGETSKNYKVYKHGKLYAGSVGFITSMTNSFCGTCNRMRITADGNLKVCLFGPEEVSLRDMLRSNCSPEELRRVVDVALGNKKAAHADMDLLKNRKNRPMVLIGGFHTSARQLKQYVKAPDPRVLSHINDNGEALMVDVSGKPITKRRAIAIGEIVFSNPLVSQLIETNSNKKGDVLGVSRVAGIMAAKQTSQLIPLCHPIMTTKITNDLSLLNNKVAVKFTVECLGQTGVEMEALIGASVALNTVYDMCKAVDKQMVIQNIRVVHKSK